MNEKTESSRTRGGAKKQPKREQPAPAPDDAIAEADENFEHTIRRLVLEKEKKRSRQPGLYR